MSWVCFGVGVGEDDKSEGSGSLERKETGLTCDDLWERIRCLISLSEETCRNSCGLPASKATGSSVTRPTPGMSRY